MAQHLAVHAEREMARRAKEIQRLVRMRWASAKACRVLFCVLVGGFFFFFSAMG
jgi:hypothetical protein